LAQNWQLPEQASSKWGINAHLFSFINQPMGSLCSTDSTTSKMASPTDKQAEVILAGCGAPKRGMGWYHAVQLLKGKCPSAVLCHVVEPWFLGGGTSRSLLI